MKFSIFLNNISNYENKFIKINNIIRNVIINLFKYLNNNDIDILIILTIFLLNIISNKYNINELYWFNNPNDIKAIVLLLLPYLYDYNITDLNEILYSQKNINKISSYIMNYDKNDIIKEYFKYSNIILGIIEENESLILYDDINNDKLIYKFIENNLLGLLQTLSIINGKTYVNWINIIPLNIENYQNSYIYINTINRLEYLSNNLDKFENIINDNLINYNGLWFGDIYNVIRIKLYEDFKNMEWLLIPYNNKYLIQELNYLFNLEKILNLPYYNYNDLLDIDKNNFIITINNINNKIKLSNTNLQNIFDRFLKKFFKNKIINGDIIDILLNKIDVLWLYLKKIVINFKNSSYGKYLLIKKDNKYYFNNFFNYKSFTDIEYNINLYNIFKLINNLIIKNNIYLDFHFISLNITNKFLFFKRIYNNNDKWFNIKNNIIILNEFKKCYINLVFEELIMSGFLSEFVSSNNFYNKNAYYYITKEKYLDKAKKQHWQSFYALNWISQIDFFHHYINHQIIYITGATGQGKTTQVPKLLLYASLIIDYKNNPKIVCSEPRISPTVDNALRVSEELGVPILNSEKKKTNNYTIQYKYKLDNHIGNSDNGYIKFITDGSILEEILKNPLLYKLDKKNNLKNKIIYDIIIIDEAHEHNVNMDILITLMRNACYINNKIRLIIVSATMDTDEPIYRRFFKDINDNLLYPIKDLLYNPFSKSYYLPQPIYMDRRYHISPPGGTTRFEIIDNYLNEELSIKDAEETGIQKVLDICNNTLTGGILFFTIGEKEIFNIINILNDKLPSGCIALPLYSKLNIKYRELISKIDINLYNIQNKRECISKEWKENYIDSKDVQKGTYKRFIIVATNIAEASITLPDLKYVIDTGYIKSNIFTYELDINSFNIQKISEVNRIQRRGRVGRINTGIVYYMYKYKGREDIKPFYKITESNIDILILKLLTNNIYLISDIDPNIYVSYVNLKTIENDNYANLINIFRENYFINNKNIKDIYFNMKINADIFYKGYTLNTLNDINGEFYLIHPFENTFKRNILNKILNKFTNNIIINNLINKKLIYNNNKTDMGISIIKYNENNINDYLNIYNSIKYNCYDEIKEINIFLNIINYSLLELSNIPWDKFIQIYNNYNSDIEFIFELIQKIKIYFNIDSTINNNIRTIIIDNIEKIKNDFINNEFSNYPINLYNKLTSLINNGSFNTKYKSIIFNDSIIQILIKNIIDKNKIMEWSSVNFFNEDKIYLFIYKLIINSISLSNDNIIINPINIYSLNKINKIINIYKISYNKQIAYPYSGLLINNYPYEILTDKLSNLNITVSKILYNNIYYINSMLYNDKIIISIIF